jgi:hypothetical protein
VPGYIYPALSMVRSGAQKKVRGFLYAIIHKEESHGKVQ